MSIEAKLSYICSMLVRLISILLLAGFLFKPIMGLYMVLDYEINKDYFAEYLCENKNRPELQCQGKCFLMQKLERSFAEKRNAHQHVLQHLTKIEILDVPYLTSIQFGKNKTLDSFVDIVQQLQPGFISTIFHPPILNQFSY